MLTSQVRQADWRSPRNRFHGYPLLFPCLLLRVSAHACFMHLCWIAAAGLLMVSMVTIWLVTPPFHISNPQLQFRIPTTIPHMGEQQELLFAYVYSKWCSANSEAHILQQHALVWAYIKNDHLVYWILEPRIGKKLRKLGTPYNTSETN